MKTLIVWICAAYNNRGVLWAMRLHTHGGVSRDAENGRPYPFTGGQSHFLGGSGGSLGKNALGAAKIGTVPFAWPWNHRLNLLHEPG